MSLDNDVDACRDCRKGPRSNARGWTDEDFEAMWTVYPSTYHVMVRHVAFGRAVDVVPCEVHRKLLEESAVQAEKTGV